MASLKEYLQSRIPGRFSDRDFETEAANYLMIRDAIDDAREVTSQVEYMKKLRSAKLEDFKIEGMHLDLTQEQIESYADDFYRLQGYEKIDTGTYKKEDTLVYSLVTFMTGTALISISTDKSI